MLYFLYPFICCWASRLVAYLGCYEWHSHNHDIPESLWCVGLESFRYILRSDIVDI